ncbi:MAG: 50S ribosomal protein L32 [Bdellovibrionales bacterium GWB1_55_8]|nr:MAG: 50S ribosomal protein L32 [Bdellovibrionales bacterium GWB1_55_8]
MATPKKKSSRSRRNMRRFAAGNKLDKPTGATCSNCNEVSRPHRVCSSCGHYEGKAILPGKVAATV